MRPPGLVTVRPATAHDLTGLLAVKPDPRLHQERLACQDDGEWTYLIATVPSGSPSIGGGGGLVHGFVVLVWGGDEHHVGYPLLADLLVRESVRGQGIGTRLMGHAEGLCRERGLPQIGLSVNPTDNPQAHSLYLRRGYRDSGQAPHCERTTLTDDQGHFRLHEDWCLCLVKNLQEVGSLPANFLVE